MQKLQNMVKLSGYLGRDVELKKFDNGKTLAKTSMATKESFKSKAGEWKDRVYWHNISAWGKTAELMHQLLEKGSRVAVMGQIHYNQYTDKDGVERNFTEIRVDEFLKLTKKQAVPF